MWLMASFISCLQPTGCPMFTALWPSAPSAAAWHADKITGGPRIGWQQRRSDSWETPPGSPPESHGYPCLSRNRGINLPTVINRKAQAVGVCGWKFPSIVSLKACRLSGVITLVYRWSLVLRYVSDSSAVVSNSPLLTNMSSFEVTQVTTSVCHFLLINVIRNSAKW